MIRINKYLAQCGVASRRNADDLVLAGRVSVNGTVIDKPGIQVDEIADEIKVDGVIVRPETDFKYLVLNKPAGYVTSLSDPHHTRTVADLVRTVSERVYPVGRLDLDTEGVLLFTNDGELAHRLTHPRYGVKRVYQARVKGEVSSVTLEKFPRGIKLPDGNIGRATATVNRVEKGHSDLVLELTEGRKREIKHLCKAVGHPVVKLVRVDFAGISCEKLKKGEWRYLTAPEVAGLRKLVGLR
jgi:pseudouridine synthase